MVFPSKKGKLILAFIKASAITQRYKNKKPKQVGQNIKIKLMVNDYEFKDKMVCDELQSLSRDITHEIVVIQKVVIGSSWNGRFYIAEKEEFGHDALSFNGKFENNVHRNVAESDYYVNYDIINKPMSTSLTEFQIEQSHEEEDVDTVSDD